MKISGILAGLFILVSGIANADDLPICIYCDPGKETEYLVSTAKVNDEELLARLIYAESVSTGYGNDPAVQEGIAWGITNRIRIAERCPVSAGIFGRGIRGVAFKKGQFNPAVSKKSRFRQDLLCPENPEIWRAAKTAATTALTGKGNPFIATAWERENSTSLVLYFYYPRSVQAGGRFAPWERDKRLRFIGDVRINEKVLSSERVRFYRLSSPPCR